MSKRLLANVDLAIINGGTGTTQTTFEISGGYSERSGAHVVATLKFHF